MIRTMETNTEKQYLVNGVAPAFPVHPGSILGEELKARGISQKKFAETVGMQATHLSALIHGTRSFTAAVTEKIASGLEGISAEFWMKSQERYNRDVQRRRMSTSQMVSGYIPTGCQVQPAYLAQPQALYDGSVIVRLTIPEADRELLESLARRFGWSYSE